MTNNSFLNCSDIETVTYGSKLVMMKYHRIEFCEVIPGNKTRRMGDVIAFERSSRKKRRLRSHVNQKVYAPPFCNLIF